jgi:hypothetical protein
MDKIINAFTQDDDNDNRQQGMCCSLLFLHCTLGALAWCSHGTLMSFTSSLKEFYNC